MLDRQYSPEVDIFVAHQKLEEQLARLLVRALLDSGYTVGVSRPREHTTEVEARATSASARAVLVIWPIREDDEVDLLKMEARSAAQRGALVQIYAGRFRHSDNFSGPTPVDFAGWDYKEPGTPWKALTRRLVPLCGPPLRRPIDKVEFTQKAVLAVTGITTMAVITGVVVQLEQDPMVAAPAPVLEAPQAPPIVHAEEAITTPVRPDGTALEGGPPPGGYKRDLGEVDQGIDVDKLPPADPPPPPPAPERTFQGPLE